MGQSRGTAALYAAIGGVSGAGCMTLVRMAARRAGWIEKTVPQVIEESLAGRLGFHPRGGAAPHHLLDNIMHWGYGATIAAMYGLLHPRRAAHRSVVASGAKFGLMSWVGGPGLLVPLMGAARPPWRRTVTENLVDLCAHLLHGVTTALVVDELVHQPEHRPDSMPARRRQRVG